MASKTQDRSTNEPPKKPVQEAYVPHPELGESGEVNRMNREPDTKKKDDDNGNGRGKPDR